VPPNGMSAYLRERFPNRLLCNTGIQIIYHRVQRSNDVIDLVDRHTQRMLAWLHVRKVIR